MRAVILAAGRGLRLGDDGVERPKVLLRFGGKTLLRRHVEILEFCGVTDVSVVVGYRADLIAEEIATLDRAGRIGMIENPRYTEGSVVSLWSAGAVLKSGSPILLMDGDVLYDWRLMRKLTEARKSNCLLMDRDIEPGEEPVKLCIAGGRIVDLHKRPQYAHEWHGESVGFFRLSAPIAADFLARAADYVAGGRNRLEYEEPLRDLIVASPPEIFGYEDISGLPWTEIDFPADVARARKAVLPRLLEITAEVGLG